MLMEVRPKFKDPPPLMGEHMLLQCYILPFRTDRQGKCGTFKSES